MLQRLRVRPVVGRHHEQRRVDLARPHQHVADQPVVAGHVHEVQDRAVGQAPGARTRHRSSCPRRRSSGSRSASMPVRARRSVVLPWSMCPAVPTTTLVRAALDPSRPSALTRRRVRGSCGLMRSVAPCRRIRQTGRAPSADAGPQRPRPAATSAQDPVRPAQRPPPDGDATGQTPNEGSTWPGSDPPPTGDSSATTRHRSGRRRRSRRPAARSTPPAPAAPPGRSAIIRQTGMSSAARPAR